MLINNLEIKLSLNQKFKDRIIPFSFLFMLSNLPIFIILLILFTLILSIHFHFIKQYLLKTLDLLLGLFVIILFDSFFIKVTVLCQIIFFIHVMLHRFFIHIVIKDVASHC